MSRRKMRTRRRGTRAPPYRTVCWTACRGRRPAAERSGTNVLGVRRPISAAAPRCHSEPVLTHWRGNPSPRRGGRLCPPRIPAAKTHLPPRPAPAAQKSDRQAPVTWLYRWNLCLYSSKYWAKEWDFMARTLDRYSWVSKESDSSSMMATATLEQWSATRS